MDGMEGVPRAARVDVACEVAVGVCSSGIFALTIDDNKSKSKSRFNRAQSFLTMPHRTSITNSRINPPLKKRHRCPLPRPTITKARHTNITLRRNIKVLRHLAMLQHRKPDVPTPQNCTASVTGGVSDVGVAGLADGAAMECTVSLSLVRLVTSSGCGATYRSMDSVS